MSLGTRGWLPVVLASLLVGGSLHAAAPVPHETLLPTPVNTAADAWLDALSAQGAHLDADAAATLRAVHPLQLGEWTVPFRVELITPAGAITVRGSLRIRSDSVAHTTVSATLDAPPASAHLAWRRLLKKATTHAEAALVGKSRSPGELRQQTVLNLTDPVTCAHELAAMRSVALPTRAGLVAHARSQISDDCRAEAIVLLSSDPTRHELAVDWFREAWNAQGPDPALVRTLTRFVDPPVDLQLLVTDLSSDAAAEERVRQRAEQERAKAPLVCFDGRVDPECVCGSDWTKCCVYHGGASHCLPPPP